MSRAGDESRPSTFQLDISSQDPLLRGGRKLWKCYRKISFYGLY